MVDLLQNQKIAYQKIKRQLQANKDIVFYGTKGIGKQTILEQLRYDNKNEAVYKNILYLDCRQRQANESVYLEPIYNIIYNSNKIKNIKSKKITFGLKHSSGIESYISKENSYNTATKEDAKIISMMSNLFYKSYKSYTKSKNKMLVVINQYKIVDKMMAEFINKIKLEYNIQFLFIDNDTNILNKYNGMNNLNFEYITIEPFDKNVVKERFIDNQEDSEILTVSDVDFIFSLADGDIDKIKFILPLIIRYKKADGTSIKHLKDIKEFLLETMYGLRKDDSYWAELLHYSSIIRDLTKEEYMCVNMVAKVINQDANISEKDSVSKARSYLQDEENFIFGLDDMAYQFLHELFYKIIFEEIKTNPKLNVDIYTKYYKKIIECYKIDYTDRYAMRASISYKSGHPNADILQALEIIVQIRELTQCIRDNNNIDQYLNIAPIKNKDIALIVQKYKILWVKYTDRRQWKDIVETIDGYYAKEDICVTKSKILRLEFDLLYSYVAAEYIVDDYRQTATNRLNNYCIDDVDNERILWLRLRLRRAAMNAAIGDYKQAKQEVEKIYLCLDQYGKNQNNNSILFYRHKFLSKSNFIYGINESLPLIKKAVQYFEKTPYITSYMMALWNYLGVLVQRLTPNNDGFYAKIKKEIEKTLKEIKSIESKYGKNSFSQREIYDNNQILANYFIGNYDIDKAIIKFERVVKYSSEGSGQELGDMVFYVNNLSILYAKKGFYQKAIDILGRLVLKIDADNPNKDDGYYMSQKINYYIFQFISTVDKQQREQIFADINNLSLYPSTEELMPNYTIKKNQFENIKSTMKHCINKNLAHSANDWEYQLMLLLSKKRISESNYTLFDRGFYYDTVYNWIDNT